MDIPLMDGDPILLAEALMAAGSPLEAADMIRTRISSGRGGLLARQVLVRALLAAGDNAAALAEAREAAALNPGVATAQSLLGEALLQGEMLPAAIGEFQRALRLEPGLDAARHGLGIAWLKAGEAQKALDAFADVAPSPERTAAIGQAQKMLEAPRSDAGYVRHLFDQFSGDYDQRMLGSLSYAGPQILRELADLVMAGRAGLAILDLGCGTGLAGMAFAGLAARLDGIDLSPAMIEKAWARGLYDNLAVGDLESALAGEGLRYDLILAADTLVYLGDLGAIFAGAARRLARNGFFLFTTETQDGQGFSLGPKRRWRHSPDYLKTMAAEAGLVVAGLVTCAPRTEANVPVEGLAVALTLPP